MRAYQKVFWVVGLASLGAFSLGGFLANVGFIPRMTAYIALGMMWTDNIVRVGTGGVFLFLLALSVYLPAATWLGKSDKVISLSNPLGPVQLSTGAVAGFLERLGEQMEGVREVKVKLEPLEEGVVESYVTLSAHGGAQGGIPRLVGDFQELVKNSLLERMGIPDVRKVEIRVGSIFHEGETQREGE